MNIISFGGYTSILGHCVRLHIEANTYYNWFDYQFEYDEALNGVRLIIEFLKIQIFLGIGANVQDCWFFDSDTYFLRMNHNKQPEYNQDDLPQVITEGVQDENW